MSVARLPLHDDWLAASEPTGDVMDVRARMAMYRALVARSAVQEQSPFWGYASQLAWQHRSGRLGAARNAIDPASWWGACNYALSVVPFAALDPAIRVAPGYATVLPVWHAALHALAGTDRDAMRVTIWRAHLASITLAVRMHERELGALPPAEQRFARGWIRMVDLFAAAALRTDLDKLVESGDGALPSRVLVDDALDDLPRAERGSVRRIGALADRPAWRWRVEVAMWRRMMRTSAARAEAESLLAALIGRGAAAWPARRRALVYLLR